MRKRQKPSALQLDQVQAQKLQEIGEHLRQNREYQQKTLDYLASQTKIQRRLLQAIETGDLKSLPEPVYIRALIRRIGDALGLASADLAEQFPLELSNTRSRRLAMDWSVGQLRPIHLYLFYIFVIFSAVNGLSVMMSRSLNQLQPSTASLLLLNPDISPAFQSAQPRTGLLSQVPEELVAPLRQSFPLQDHFNPNTWLRKSRDLVAQLPDPGTYTQQPVAVQLSLETQSWVRVTVDGNTEFEGMMLAGSQRLWQGQEQIRVRAGNAGGVRVVHNNKPAELMGEPGAVEERIFTPDAGNPSTLALLTPKP